MSKYNYFNVISVTETSFPATAQVNFTFSTQGICLLNRSLVAVQYSFDGSTVHGDLNPDDASSGIFFDNRYESRIWFRVASGTATVRVEGWGGS
jgi:hypothetical protein